MPFAISADGTSVVGAACNCGAFPFRWTEATGSQMIGLPYWYLANSVSNHGAFVGFSTYGGMYDVSGGVWSANGDQHYYDRQYFAITPDAVSIGGGIWYPDWCIPHRAIGPALFDRATDSIILIGGTYTPVLNNSECESAPFDLPNIEGTVRFISPDGLIALGVETRNNAIQRWFRYDRGTDAVTFLPGLQAYSVIGMSADGTSVFATNATSTVRFANMQISPIVDGFIAKGVSADGKTLVGATTGCSQAAIWTDGTGIVKLRDLLASSGIDELLDWNLSDATAVSADGRTLAGTGYNFVTGRGWGEVEGWIATLPDAMPAVTTLCVGDYNLDGGVDGDDIAAFFGSWEQGAVRADVSCDGGVDAEDVSAFFDRWQNGC
jgi:hypothetical protein